MGTERPAVRRFAEAVALALTAGVLTAVAQLCFSPEIAWPLVVLAVGVGALIGFFVGLRPGAPGRTSTSERSPGVLRQEQDETGTRSLSARMERGAVVIEGLDRGAGVEGVFGPGNREYEWIWTVPASEVPKLVRALGFEDPIAGLTARFSDDDAADLKSFLDESGIELETWSRIGD